MTARTFFITIFLLTPCFLSCNQPQSAAHETVAPAPAEPTNPHDPEASPTSVSGRPLRIMSYNVLRYGSGCQDNNAALHGYLRSIIRYANPDVAGLVKVDAIPSAAGDQSGDAPFGFADSIRNHAFNTAYPGRYAVAPFTNKAAANNVNLLFYDQQKLGYAGMETLTSDETDFNLFRLYLKSSVKAGQADTTFLYFILNHTESGDQSQDRDRQMKGVMAALHRRFTQLPNIINMGDFNLRNTEEAGYAALVTGPDAAFRFADPPFALDHAVKYPADWEHHPEDYARWLTTSTRKKEKKPNDCGTSGGAKFWYDHMLVSPALAAGREGWKYKPGSFLVIGNDGNRIERSVNADKNPNRAVPQPIAEALFQLSNKYPVMLELVPTGK